MRTKWISVAEAAEKYNIEYEIIKFWILLGKFKATDDTADELMLNEKKLDKYIRWRKKHPVPAEYADELELQCFRLKLKVEVCMLSVRMRDIEIERLRKENQLLGELKKEIGMGEEKFAEAQKEKREKMNLPVFE